MATRGRSSESVLSRDTGTAVGLSAKSEEEEEGAMKTKREPRGQSRVGTRNSLGQVDNTETRFRLTHLQTGLEFVTGVLH